MPLPLVLNPLPETVIAVLPDGFSSVVDSGSSKASGKASAKSNASGNGLDEVDVQTQQAATNSPLQTAAVAGTGAILGALIFGAGILVGRRQKSVD